MNEFKNILLASHGTKGARAAELYALSLCSTASRIDHLEIVPDFWKGMMGDDWLNNAATQDTFGQYVENQLEAEFRVHIESLQKEFTDAGIAYTPVVTFGDPTDCLLKQASEQAYDVIVAGCRRPKGEAGYNSRLDFVKLSKLINVPLILVPYPK